MIQQFFWIVKGRYILPSYDYKCEACDYEFEEFHAMSAKPLINCPKCYQPTLIKLIGIGAAVIVRGTTTPCHGGRSNTKPKKQRMNPKNSDKLGKGKNKGAKPFWRDGPINKKVLKNPEKYIREGEVD